MRTVFASCGIAGGLLTLAFATPALAAKPVAVKLECQATKPGWTEPREFSVSFERSSNNLRDVAITEQARVFTPTDAAAIYTAGKRGGVIVDVPAQRPGKWVGKPNGGVDEFELKTKDGSASFAVTPDATDKTLRALTWRAAMTGPDGEQLTAEGAGTCRVVSTEVDAPPTPEADAAPAPAPEATPAPLADSTPAPKKPRKEIRIFGGRKGASTDGGEE